MIDSRIGPWHLERELGRGGMGTVYLARRVADDPTLPERAAVKVLAGFLTQDEGARVRFEREIEVLRKLAHPHIVRLFEAGEDRGLRYYSMEHVEGESYESILAGRSRLPWPEVLDLALQIAPALKHAHDHGVIHRDLKPSNLLRGAPADAEIGRFGLVKLTDFGIAWVFAGRHLTVTGAVVGTAEYLSPEQAAGKSPTRRSDLYSLGIVLYTLLTGSPPFVGEGLDVLHKQRYAQAENLVRMLPDIPPDLAELIHQLLEKEPDKRPPDAGVLFRKLDSLRRKYERRAAQSTPSAVESATSDDGRTRASRQGPATTMAQLLRQELDRQKFGGPLQRLFNHPAVLVPLFLATVGLIVWALLPSSPEKLYERGAVLMRSDDPADWELGWDKFLSELQEHHPDFRPEEVEKFRLQAETARERRLEERDARLVGAMSEAHWFYEQGLRLHQQGKDQEAKRVWQRLVEAFANVPAETVWVDRARRALDGEPVKPPRMGEERWKSVRASLAEARRLEDEGRMDEAKTIRQALEALYRGDPSARPVLDR